MLPLKTPEQLQMESFNVLIQHEPRWEDSESMSMDLNNSHRNSHRKSSKRHKKQIVTPGHTDLTSDTP